jgi:putative phage-type endonuclease
MNYVVTPLQQGTDEWLAHRLEGFGSTDSSILMGLNKYESVRNLYLVKSKQVQAEFKENAAMAHGTANEDLIRQLFTRATDIEVKPACVVNKTFSFIRSSLDGLSEDGKIIFEAKAPFVFRNHMKNKSDLPEYYYSQVQHHLLATEGAEKVYFCSWRADSGLHIQVYYPDLVFIKELVRRMSLFKILVDNKLEFSDNMFSKFSLEYLFNKCLI